MLPGFVLLWFLLLFEHQLHSPLLLFPLDLTRAMEISLHIVRASGVEKERISYFHFENSLGTSLTCHVCTSASRWPTTPVAGWGLHHKEGTTSNTATGKPLWIGHWARPFLLHRSLTFSSLQDCPHKLGKCYISLFGLEMKLPCCAFHSITLFLPSLVITPDHFLYLYLPLHVQNLLLIFIYLFTTSCAKYSVHEIVNLHKEMN